MKIQKIIQNFRKTINESYEVRKFWIDPGGKDHWFAFEDHDEWIEQHGPVSEAAVREGWIRGYIEDNYLAFSLQNPTNESLKAATDLIRTINKNNILIDSSDASISKEFSSFQVDKAIRFLNGAFKRF